MPLSRRLFRESALERLSSPEQLDQLLQVTSPRGWFALLALWALLGAVIVWSLIGTVATKERGQGILMRSGALRIVEAGGNGRLLEISVKAGDRVEEHQVVAEIGRPDLVEAIDEAKEELKNLREQHLVFDGLDEQAEDEENARFGETQTKIEHNIEAIERQIVFLSKQKTSTDELVQSGNALPLEVLELESDIAAREAEISKAQRELTALRGTLEAARLKRKSDSKKRETAEENLVSKIGTLEVRLDRESKVRNRVAGEVVEVRAAAQTVVKVGDDILLVEPRTEQAVEGGELEAILYVSAATGKKIKPGMKVNVNPSTVKQEEYGSMKATVRSIASVPTSKPAMMAVLTDADLVDRLTEQIGLPLEMRVDLTPAAETDSGYLWSSKKGPPVTISAGTLCSGSVTVNEQRPIALVIPILRSVFSDS
jgi:HlyD family secretion protein